MNSLYLICWIPFCHDMYNDIDILDVLLRETVGVVQVNAPFSPLLAA